MLRRGIQACDIFAVRAIERADWRSLVPDLTRAVAAENIDFRVEVILALKTLGSADDFTNELIAGLGAGSTEARISAAMGARHFSLNRMRAPLLDRVRRDPSFLVRVHAVDSLFELADIYPRNPYEHPAIGPALSGPRADKPSLSDVFGWGAPSADDLARFAEAANQLDRTIADRLAQGPCAKRVPLTAVDLHVIRISHGVVALAVDGSIGSCERQIAFVSFLQSPGGFDRWLQQGTSGRDPLQTSIETLPTPVTVQYRRATKVLTVGSLAVDTTKANVLVLSAGAKGVVVRHRALQPLVFERHAQPSYGDDLLRFHPEIATAVRTLLDRSPELRDLVAAPAPQGPGTRR